MIQDLAFGSIIVYVLYSLYRSYVSDKRTTQAKESILNLIPEYFPVDIIRNGDKVSFKRREPESVTPTEPTEEQVMESLKANAQAGYKLAEYKIRQNLDEIAYDILKAHTFNLEVNKAYDIAEGVLLEMYARNDRPISDRVKSLLPEDPSPSIGAATMQKTPPPVFQQPQAPIQ